MLLDRKAIETISVSAVRNSIVTSPFLDQFIADNDKEPSWDGNVYIYEDTSKKKNKLKGRLPVQVKGKICADFSADEISYSMDVSDLRNYLYDGGVVLFVVYMNASGTATQIYYSELTPLKLRFELDNAKAQKSKTVKLKKFPEDGNKKATIFLNCLQNCQKQASFTDAKLYSLEELEKTGLLESLTIPLVGAGVFDPKMLLVTSEAYLYANIRGSSIPQPIELLPKGIVTREEVSNDVVIDDYIHYKKYSVIKSAESTTVQFGESFKITFEEKKPSCKMNYKNSTKLRSLATDLHFLLNYIEKGYFQVGSAKFPFDKSGASFNDFDINKEKGRLLFAQRSVTVLDMLGYKEDLDVTKLTGEDIRNLERLAVALIDKEPVSGLKPDLPPVLLITVADLKFVLLFTKGESEGEYSIFDFFKSELSVAYEGANGEMIPTSQYAILHADYLLKIQNIQSELFLPSFQKVETEDKYTRANWFLLELLEAYDNSNDQRQDLLKAADDFSKWLYESPDQYLDYHIKCLNRYQVLKRERELTIDEVAELWGIAEDNSVTDECKLGAYLLLDLQVPAKRHFEKLAEEAQTAFRTYPIFRYYKPEENN